MVAAITLCPTLLAQWKALGPFGGSAALVQVDPHTSGTIIAGTNNALLFRTRDGGETWEPLSFPAQLRAVLHALVIHPRSADVYLAGISPESPAASGLLRSTDGGAVWQSVPAFRNVQVRAIALYRGDPQVMAAGTDSGIFQTRDGGLNWIRISPADNSELRPVVSVAFDPKDRDTIYAGTPHLPWKTTDGGATWHSVHTGMIDDSDVFSILVDRNRPRRVFASACSGIYRSFNGGSTWTRLPTAKDASYRTYTIVQDPQYENILFAGTTHGMIRSGDGGATWERIAAYATRSIAFDLRRLGRIYIATDEVGILRSDNNGRTWHQVNHGFCNRRLTPLAVGYHNALYTGTTYDAADGGLFRLASGAENWSKIAPSTRLFGEPILNVVPAAGQRGRLYAVTAGSVAVSRDAGKTWRRLAAPAARLWLTDLFAPSRAAGLNISVAGSSLFASPDSATTWKKPRLPGDADIRSLVSLEPPLMAAISASDIFLSSDAETWIACARMPGGAEVLGIAPLSGPNLLAATSAGLRVSANLGASWRAVGGTLEGNTIQAICRHPVRTSVLFAARYGAIYMSSDRGRSWVRISPDPWPVCSVKQLLVVPGTPDRLFVLTHQQGVFVWSLDSEVEEITLPVGEPFAVRP
jgi:photosystem II stability/assembly factor-like uncharacterized protein